MSIDKCFVSSCLIDYVMYETDCFKNKQKILKRNSAKSYNAFEAVWVLSLLFFFSDFSDCSDKSDEANCSQQFYECFDHIGKTFES